MKWVKLDQKGAVPIARSSHSLTADGDKIYCYGGEHVSRTPVGSDIYVYDVPSETWALLQVSGSPPPPRIAHTAALVGHLLYVFGGRSGVDMGEGALNDMFTFNTQTNEWQAISSQGSLPAARSFHTMTAVGSKLYVFGGCGQTGRLNDLYSFDTSTNTWQELSSSASIAPRGGSWLSAVNGGKQLCVVGGFCGKELNDLHLFDLETGAWQCPTCCDTKSNLTARSVFGGSCHVCDEGSACSWTDQLLVFGGEVDPSEVGHSGAGQFSADVWAFQSEKGWEKLKPEGESPCARGWFATTRTHDGSLVVHGGLNDANERLGDLYMLKVH